MNYSNRDNFWDSYKRAFCYEGQSTANYDDFYINNSSNITSRVIKPQIIQKVIFNDPCTIILWSDKTKTIVKCGEDEKYDPEKGMAMAISKKFFGNKGDYYENFKKWLPEEEDPDSDTMEQPKNALNDVFGNRHDVFRNLERRIEKDIKSTRSLQSVMQDYYMNEED